jgi:hypothetical protein
MDVVKNKDGVDCLVASSSYKAELMTPELECVTGPLNLPVWRYLKFEHFSTLLKNQKIYLPRASELDDKLEGSFGATDDPLTDRHSQLDEKDKETLRKSWYKLRQGMMQNLFYVSCWHMSEHESEMHWTRYGNRHEEAVAIRSTIGKLCTLRPKCITIDETEFIPQLWAGEVNYIDHSIKGAIPKNALTLFYKANHFRGDGEFRVVVNLWSMGFSPHDRPGLPKGLEIDLAPKAMFDLIIPGPNNPGLKEKIESVLDETGFDIPVQTSTLEQSPSW